MGIVEVMAKGRASARSYNLDTCTYDFDTAYVMIFFKNGKADQVIVNLYYKVIELEPEDVEYSDRLEVLIWLESKGVL